MLQKREMRKGLEGRRCVLKSSLEISRASAELKTSVSQMAVCIIRVEVLL
jgi:hypothetical protein